MKTVGVITEYNPFHNGHLYHLEQTRKKTRCDNIIAVMSGDYVQRGQPALINKFIRAKMALLCGVDIVIELPAVFSTASAEGFAYGAVRLLDSLNTVDEISFGSEDGDINKLISAADILFSESDEFKKLLRDALGNGGSYPSARQAALEGITQSNADFLSLPNNILGIEYLKALSRLKSNIHPITVARVGSSHNSPKINGIICSASAIRNAVLENNYTDIKAVMPAPAYELLMDEINANRIAALNNLSQLFQYVIKTKKPDELASILDVDEGLENRLLHSAENNFFLEDIINSAKTKRYTHTRLRRAAIHILLDIKRSDAALYSTKEAGYIRVLGFKKDKSFLIDKIQHSAKLPVLVMTRRDMAKLSQLSYFMLNAELRSSDMYNLALNCRAALFKKNSDLFKHPVIL